MENLTTLLIVITILLEVTVIFTILILLNRLADTLPDKETLWQKIKKPFLKTQFLDSFTPQEKWANANEVADLLEK